MNNIEENIEKSFSEYNAEKMSSLLTKRYKDDFFPKGFVLYVRLVEGDIQTGIDGFTRRKITASPIVVLNKEIVMFAKNMRGDEFAEEVKKEVGDEKCLIC